MIRPLVIPLLLSAATASAAPGADAARLWTHKIQPLFDVQCVKCHGPIEQKGGLELDTPQAVLKGGEDGPVIVAGKPEESSLYKKLAVGADPHMPPKKQLSEAEQELVKQWITAMEAAPVQNAVTSKPKREFKSIPEAIDTLIAESWQIHGVQPANSVEESLWCRRVYLDLAGRIPSQQEADAFLALPEANRREALVDQLLASKEYPVRMRELWDTFLMGRAKRPGQEDKRKQNAWWTFLETAFRTNRPWDDTVRTVLSGRVHKPEDKGVTWFLYERKNDHQAIAEAVAPIVYATKMDCAQCHDHPLAREIKQGHYWGLVTAFNRGKNVEGTNEVAESAVGGFVNFTNLKKESQPAVVTLLTGSTLSETWLAGDKKEEDGDDKYVDPKAKVRVPKYSRREAFADLATHENPLLAKAFVNRMWAALLGRGIVHPADEINARNLPSHPELLEWLAKDFAEHGHDARRLVRGLALSRVYALAQGTGGLAPDAFACAPERPLTGEQISRSLRVAAGLPPEDEALRRAVVTAIPDVLPKEYNASFQQALFLTNSPAVAKLLQPAPGGTLEKIAALSDRPAQINAAFLTAYGRNPDPEEASQALDFLSKRKEKPAEAIRDLLWALLCSAEFLTMP